MSAKLEEGMYKDRFAFAADFSLMINNAKQYNVAGSYAHNEATIVENFFEKREQFALFASMTVTDLSLQNGCGLTKLWKQQIKPPIYHPNVPLCLRRQLLQLPSRPQ